MPKTDKKLKSLHESVSEAMSTGFEINPSRMPVRIIERFRKEAQGITDHRAVWDIEYPLESIILMVFFAVLGGCDTWVDIEIFCRRKKDWLNQFIELPNGHTPCNDTFSRVFHRIDTDEFQKMTVRFITENLVQIKKALGIQESKVKHYAIDGKQERGTGRLPGTDKEIPDQQTLHIYESTDGVCVMSKKIDKKTNEIPEAQKLLESMDSLKDVIISGDAMHTQAKHTEIITRKGGDYVFGLKGNQSDLKDNVELLFTDEKIAEIKKEGINYFRTSEKAHGQTETREYYMIDCTGMSFNESGKWKGLHSVMLVIKTCVNNTTNKESKERRYYISSLEDIEMFATIIRQHWSCEIQHFFQDYVFHQDMNQTVDENAFQNLACMKKMVLTLIRIYAVLQNLSVNLTRKKIGWDPEAEIAALLSFYDEETLEKALNASAKSPEKTKRSRIKVKTVQEQMAKQNLQ